MVTHGNGPQVGLLALQAVAGPKDGVYPLDILGAESEGMIGYLIEQELTNRLPPGTPTATLLTQVRVDPDDVAFAIPTKPIGTFRGGTIVLTSSVAELPEMVKAAALCKLREYEEFEKDADPRNEHDFLKFELCNRSFIFHIACYDFDLKLASTDPADPR